MVDDEDPAAGMRDAADKLDGYLARVRRSYRAGEWMLAVLVLLWALNLGLVVFTYPRGVPWLALAVVAIPTASMVFQAWSLGQMKSDLWHIGADAALMRRMAAAADDARREMRKLRDDEPGN
jgi:hypothetical protein